MFELWEKLDSFYKILSKKNKLVFFLNYALFLIGFMLKTSCYMFKKATLKVK